MYNELMYNVFMWTMIGVVITFGVIAVAFTVYGFIDLLRIEKRKNQIKEEKENTEEKSD